MEVAAAERGDGEGSAVEVLFKPAALEGEMEQGGGDGACEVGAALAPIEAGTGEAASLGACGFDVDAESGEGCCALRSEIVVAVVFFVADFFFRATLRGSF